MNADPRVMEFFPSTYDRTKAEDFAARAREDLERRIGWWVVAEKNGSPFLGVISLQAVPFEAHFTPANEIGWRLAFDHWGRGFATEAARAAHYALSQLGWHEVIAMTSQLNARSQRLMQRLGMTRDPKDDFDHPRIAKGNRLRRHVLYRLKQGR